MLLNSELEKRLTAFYALALSNLVLRPCQTERTFMGVPGHAGHLYMWIYCDYFHRHW